MTLIGVLQILIYLIVLLALVRPLGGYMARVKERVDALRRSQPGPDKLIPVDLVTASGSGPLKSTNLT